VIKLTQGVQDGLLNGLMCFQVVPACNADPMGSRTDNTFTAAAAAAVEHIPMSHNAPYTEGPAFVADICDITYLKSYILEV